MGNKRLLKRHKRQVARAKMNPKLSEPDVRTQEQIEAAREASRRDLGGHIVPGVRGAIAGRKGSQPMAKSAGTRTDAS